MFASANAAQFSLLIPSVGHDFQVLAFHGTEAISTLYAIEVELASERPDVDLESLLCQPAFLQFGLRGEGLHGHIDDVRVSESGHRLTRYQLRLVPALHYLQFSHDQRIFQHQTVPQIVVQVLAKHGIQADSYAFHVTSSPEREYCTQYLESDFEFIQRLCSEDGIAWYHRHSQHGHQLIFTDVQHHPDKVDETPYHPHSGQTPEHPVISQFGLRVSTRTRIATRRGYDFRRPKLLRESRCATEVGPGLEDYLYPVPVEDDKQRRQRTRVAMERHRADYQLAEGESDQPTLRSGHYFQLTGHPRQHYNERWMLLSVTHTGKQPQVLEEVSSHDANPEHGPGQGYRNRFTAIPLNVPYRPPLLTRKTVLVSQTARVTGPADEEIFCDEYGRVKVEFHWDRAGLGSDKSSCWLRVSSSWAGLNFGAVTIPRVGMEVVVTFLEGNPDNPLITGCVLNGRTPAPYPLPANKTRTVLRSHSSPKSGGYNELSIEDRSGQELIYLRAQRDMEQNVQHDSRLEVGNQRLETIKGNSITVLEAEEHHTVNADRKIDLKASNYVQVAQSSHTLVGQTLVAEAGQQVHLKAGANLILDAGASITLRAGGQHIVIGAGGIFSSSEIQLGGAPAKGTAAVALQPGVTLTLATPAPLPVMAPTQNALIAAAKARGADFCPLCEACRNGQCQPEGISS